MRASRIFSLILIALVGLIAYSNIFNNLFVYDDLNNIAENPLIKNLDNFIFPAGGYKGYLPRAVGFFTFALNYHFGGLNVTGYHIVNLAIHITNAILVYFLVILTLKTPYFRWQLSGVNDSPPSSPLKLRGDREGLLIGLFAALLFVSHPVQTQAVTYIVQRLTSLATMFYLLSVVMYIKARLARQEEIGDGQGAIESQKAFVSIPFFVPSLVSSILAMLTKEMAFTLPVVIILYEFTFFRSSLKKKLLFLLPLLLTLIIIPLGIMGIDKPLGDILSDLSERIRVQTEMSRWDYLFTQFRVIVTYIRLLFLPINQNLDYDYPVYHSLFTPPVFLSFLLLLSILGITGYLIYKTRAVSCQLTDMSNTRPASPLSLTGEFMGVYRLIAFSILWFFITLSVESSIIPIVDVIFEHRVYLPSAGAFIAVSTVLFIITERLKVRWPQINKAAISLFTLIVIVLSTATYSRNAVWRDELSLWEDVVKKSPRNTRGHFNLGVACNSKGLGDRAIEHLELALKLNPYDPETYYNLGLAYSSKGITDKAIEHFKTALRIKPDFQEAHYDLGVDYLFFGLTDQAIEHFIIALKLNPEDPAAHNNLGIAYASKGLNDQAIEHFRSALRLKPDFQDAYNNLNLVLRHNK